MVKISDLYFKPRIFRLLIFLFDNERTCASCNYFRKRYQYLRCINKEHEVEVKGPGICIPRYSLITELDVDVGTTGCKCEHWELIKV